MHMGTYYHKCPRYFTMYALVIFCVFQITYGFEVPYNPLINEGLFEGDILGVDPNEDRNAVPRDSQLWPGGAVPYIISPELEFMRADIEKAMKHIEDNSCIRFVKRTHERDYVNIFRHTGCYSHWGRIGGENLLSLGKGCQNFIIIVHELMHAVGFEHEHNRSDRDEYVRINWENIEPKWYYAFEKLQPVQNRLLTRFDINSVMLYGSTFFAKSWNKYSMVTKDGNYIPQTYDKKSLSELDSLRIRMLYKCKQ
ncbi:astacin-like metalloprotease toxin 5 [Parasteatoda tepidariorum]|uniref:astacin-like metalloprotease toxin 5 n=1 Tax=Parasteatoda tepidariorum TaxID=114398 RepID=UPI001C723146|nr:astacin-like metalloprotease toxin 5 [Parasteatoda tepidariorum]